MTPQTKASQLFNQCYTGPSDTHTRAITKAFMRRYAHKADRAAAKRDLKAVH